ncbi:phospholipase D-like domain-containing protein [Marilutibacter chinensis]|uniref:phospholipase D n=1 Tax=Marilutibacter chinensis TaxID=2912247 RepID=A0ABS9HTQ2_9GAMM|nr:phospholipase D-like domain-containing protein [Lysobacter chinensis]MCF7221688.1 phospholipase D-like domain-containing protein [Lysobacter chinensis]
MDFDQLDRQLRESLDDQRLDNDERDELRRLGERIDRERVRYLRNRAFAMVREGLQTQPQDTLALLKWLEQVVKTLDTATAVATVESTACFTPGDSCLRKLRELCRDARATIDICVYTISDDRLRAAILDAHARGVRVRVISDNDKMYDTGNDVGWLRERGVPVRLDDTPHHMHHKFALFDGRMLANGSFNWTRSASVHNQENLAVTDNAHLVRCYAGQFEALWARYAG